MREDVSQFQQKPLNSDNTAEVIEAEPTPKVEIVNSNQGDGLQTNLQEIERLEKVVNNTKASLNQTREMLGIPASDEIPPSILKEKDRITELRKFSKRYHHPYYRSRLAADLNAAKKTGNPEAVLEQFYAATSDEKEVFELQEKERDIAGLMKEKGTLFMHSMPLSSVTGGFAEYNRSIDVGKADFEDRYKILEGAQPVISVSVPSPERVDNGLFRRSGVILGGGKILSAKEKNSFSTAHGLYKRVQGTYDKEHIISSIHPKLRNPKTV